MGFKNNTPQLTVVFEGICIAVQWEALDRLENRCSWNYRIYDPDAWEPALAEGSDLRTSGDNSTAYEAFEALISFIETWAESSAGGENANLFPQSMADAVRPADWQTWCFHVRTYICGPVRG